MATKKAVKESRRVQALKAARNLVKAGWVKGTSRSSSVVNGVPYHSFCATGAVGEVAGRFGVDAIRLVNVLKKNLPLKAKAKKQDTVEFNDDSKTTKGQVLRVFDRAIRSLKG